MIDYEMACVRAMHKRHGLEPRPAVPTVPSIDVMRDRLNFLSEELSEFACACFSQPGETADLPAMLDALVDLVYVAKGTAAMAGITPEVWANAFDDVHQSQASKVRGVGKRGTPNDLVKPPGWVAPDHATRLRAAGWVP